MATDVVADECMIMYAYGDGCSRGLSLICQDVDSHLGPLKLARTDNHEPCRRANRPAAEHLASDEQDWSPDDVAAGASGSSLGVRRLS
jgi:hypothetical protein